MLADCLPAEAPFARGWLAGVNNSGWPIEIRFVGKFIL